MIKFYGDDIPSSKLPEPSGYRVLIGRLKVEEKTAGGIIMTSDYNRAKENNTSLAKVLAIGNTAFKSKIFKESEHDNAPCVPWCEVGDIVLVSRYTGLDVDVIENDEMETLKIINDDEILSKINDAQAMII